jgi:hypothetical protein
VQEGVDELAVLTQRAGDVVPRRAPVENEVMKRG